MPAEYDSCARRYSVEEADELGDVFARLFNVKDGMTRLTARHAMSTHVQGVHLRFPACRDGAGEGVQLIPVSRRAVYQDDDGAGVAAPDVMPVSESTAVGSGKGRGGGQVGYVQRGQSGETAAWEDYGRSRRKFRRGAIILAQRRPVQSGDTIAGRGRAGPEQTERARQINYAHSSR